jgi:hypothetical protein
MPMIEFSGAKGGSVWVNPAQVIYLGQPDGAGASMYGENNNRARTRLFFTQGAHLDVNEAINDVVARMNKGSASADSD